MKILSLVLTAIIAISLITVSCCPSATATPTGTVNAWLNAWECQNAQEMLSYENEVALASRLDVNEPFSITNRNLVVDYETATTVTMSANFNWAIVAENAYTYPRDMIFVLIKVDDKWLISAYVDDTGGYFRKGERMNVETAVVAMMVENEMVTIPNPHNVVDGVAYNDMTVFPDSTSAVTVDKVNDPHSSAYQVGDKDGYVLYQHDKTADGRSTTGLVNYMPMETTICFYTCEADGTIRQWSDVDMTMEYTD